MKNLLSIAFALLLSVAGWGQNQSPVMQVTGLHGKEKPVRISDIKIDVRVVGSLAVTTVDMTFFNPNRRVLEGELQFPLAEGQNISRFALDINGKLREGVVVEKAKGQQVFETIIRQGVDPGLLEKTTGNNFRTRVYPLPSQGNRRVVIAYEQELIPDNGNYRFHLPIEYGGVIDNFSVNLAVYTAGPKPKVDNSPWGNFGFNKAGDAYVAEYSANDYPAKGQIVFSVPVKEDIQLYVEKGKIDNKTTFYTHLMPRVNQSAKKLPNRIALFWDTSMSMNKRDMKLETGLLDKYFNRIGNVTVDLYTFNFKTGKPRTFKIANGNLSDLKTALTESIYDGATHMGALDFSKVKADEILVFTDGLSNFGKGIPVTGNTPIITVTSGLSADYNLLRYLSNTTGGVSVNLSQQSPDEAAKAIGNESLRLVSADYDKSKISGLTTSGNIVDPKKGISIAGKLKADKATVTLNFGTGSRISFSKTITVDKDAAVDYGNIVERLWAAKLITELDQLYDINKDKIEELGRQYNIVTRNTSLIVLDNVEDYARYRITPPDELLKEYNQILSREAEQLSRYKQERIERVVMMLKRRKEWWNTEFAVKLEPEKKNTAKNANQTTDQ